MTLRAFSVAILLIATQAFIVTARGQNLPKTATTALQQAVLACLPAESMTAPELYGTWLVHYSQPPAGLPAAATLVLQGHAEFSESLAGTVSRAGAAPALMRAVLAGDLDSGLLLLDESADNIRITATWNADMVAGSCGMEFAGLWKDMTQDDAPGVPFTMKKRI